MSTSKPMSDGGKGSVRRNEDNEAYQNGWDRIFKRTKEEKEQEPMLDKDDIFYVPDDDEDGEHEWCCEVCGGPMHRTEDGRHGQCDDCGRYCDLESDI